MDVTLTETQGNRTIDEHGRDQKVKLLGLDDSYFIAYSFMVDEMNSSN
jgi:hypothetical protein